MDVISNILELYPIQVGLVIILVCIVLFLTEIFTSDLQKKKNQIIVQNSRDYNLLKNALPSVPVTSLKGAGVEVEKFSPKCSLN